MGKKSLPFAVCQHIFLPFGIFAWMWIARMNHKFTNITGNCNEFLTLNIQQSFTTFLWKKSERRKRCNILVMVKGVEFWRFVINCHFVQWDGFSMKLHFFLYIKMYHQHSMNYHFLFEIFSIVFSTVLEPSLILVNRQNQKKTIKTL